MGRHTLSCVKLASAQVGGVQRSSVSPAVDHFLVSGDGSIHDRMVAVSEQKPVAEFETVMLATAIAAFGLGGLKISDNPLDLYFTELDDGGSRKSTGEKISISKGLLVPTRLTGSQGNAPVRLAYQAFAGGVAGTCSLAVATGQTIPTEVDIDEAFTIGPAEINGSSVGAITDVSLDFGFQVQQLMGDGNVWPLAVVIMKRQPTLQFTVQSAAALNAIGVTGNDDTVEVQLQKLESGGTRAATGHLYLTTTRNRVTVDTLSADHGNEGPAVVKVTPAWDGTNDPIAVAEAGS